MKRMFQTLCIALALSGCVSMPNTKALITPIGAAGYHTFAPPNSDRVRAPSISNVDVGADLGTVPNAPHDDEATPGD